MGSGTILMATFETELGRCGVVDEAGITACCCRRPAGDRVRPTRWIRGPEFRAPGDRGIIAVMAGEARPSRRPLDERGIDDFRRAVYTATREIPAGTTRSYGEVARAIGRPDGARDVGTALARNPFPIIVPCHRVVAANGRHRVLGTGRPGDEAADARARGRAGLRPAGPFG